MRVDASEMLSVQNGCVQPHERREEKEEKEEEEQEKKKEEEEEEEERVGSSGSPRSPRSAQNYEGPKRTYVCFMINALGVTAGAHRLWSHRSYKAKLPLRIFLAAANSMAFQNDIFEWSRDHRVHHKYSETDADPHNAKRGFFFAHVGWLFVRKHQDVIEKGKRLDLSDLLADPVVVFQRKYYKISVVLMCFVVPTLVPWYFWGESLWNGYFLSSILRYTISLNVSWLVNSAAHMYGNRPYDKTISPRENCFVTFGAIGEGFHNYHHTFPFDYSTSEFGLHLNPTTCFIDLMCWLGLASNRKKASPEMIQARKLRTGDGSA
ncbi:stearoyl-CoA desaturase 5-like [Scleropages formosus]|uniref:Stearoyl-CoA desaturase 5-like n=1 Tax=Scleropages formosus TaxID=113540 RepID=A0A0P7WWW7_SCLFO|nr:stearoyl-CoA desaturase 5-like [Scleropages formosus]